MLWVYIVGALLTVSLLFFVSFAIIFSFQKLHCTADRRILCWADWTCNGATPSSPSINTFINHFEPYANKCLFGNTCEVEPDLVNHINGGWTGTNVPSTTNPYTGGSTNVYNTQYPASDSPQNMFGSAYPAGLVT